MTKDVEVKVGDQVLRLAKHDSLYAAALQLTLSNSSDGFKQEFSFSIESATDTVGSAEDSGVYNMNVHQMTADTDPIIHIKEIQVM